MLSPVVIMRTAVRRIGIELCSFALFAAAYYAPFILEASDLAVSDGRVRHLLDEALSVSAIQIELARNALVHVSMLALCHTALAFVANRFGIATRIATWVSRLIFLVAGWLLLVASNGVLFPLSDYAYAFLALAQPEIAIALVFLLAGGGIVALWGARPKLQPLLVILGVVGVAGIVGGAGSLNAESKPAALARNIIIIGVDSLSAMTFEENLEILPTLAQLLGQSTSFDRAYTPLGRTFPAWMSILSGMSPAEHGGVFNLRNMEHVKREALFTHTLREQGYRTIFAIDERRFANIDLSFGFDRVIGPKPGALDFLLQRFNDTPMTNLLLQSRLAHWALPFSYLNTASHPNYDAAGFVEQVAAATSAAERIFLAVHFESAHFPFKARHATQQISGPNTFLARHVTALTGVDYQVGQLMSWLMEEGFLDDALVIVLSDHGESLGDLESRTTKGGVPFEIAGFGHGTHLLSERENRVVLGMIPFKDGLPARQASRRDDLVSLTDVRGVIERYSATGDFSLEPKNDCMLVETGVRFVSASNYRTLDPTKLAAESASYYEIDPVGRMRLREDRLSTLIANKDVGLRCADRLTFFSNNDQRHFAYRIDDGGRQLTEIEPASADVSRIEAYRRRLSELKKVGSDSTFFPAT